MELFYVQLTNLAFLLTVGAFLLTILAIFAYSGSSFAYSGKVRLIRALRDCKQRSLTVSKKAPTVSTKSFPPNENNLKNCHVFLLLNLQCIVSEGL